MKNIDPEAITIGCVSQNLRVQIWGVVIFLILILLEQ